MPIINPIAILIMAPMAIAFVWALAALPAYPYSKIALGVWIAILGLMTAALIYQRLNPHPMQIWIAPARSAVLVLVLLYAPFVASFLCWRWRRVTNPTVSARTAVLVVVATCICSVILVQQFNKSCVFYEVWHDGGQAWCPEPWQAHYR